MKPNWPLPSDPFSPPPALTGSSSGYLHWCIFRSSEKMFRSPHLHSCYLNVSQMWTADVKATPSPKESEPQASSHFTTQQWFPSLRACEVEYSPQGLEAHTDRADHRQVLSSVTLTYGSEHPTAKSLCRKVCMVAHTCSHSTSGG